MIFSIYLTSLLRALSLALELSDGGLSRHHWRTAMICDRIAEAIGLPQEERNTLLHSALLHDIGAASVWQEKSNLYHRIPVSNLFAHAESGYLLLRDSPHFGRLATPIRHHHDRWDGVSALAGKRGADIPLLGRIINLADSVEVLLREDPYILEQAAPILAEIRQMSGKNLDPDLVAVFHTLARKECFWFDLANPHYYTAFFAKADAAGQIRLNIDDVLDIADIFATIIDRTSRYTAKHSRSVAEVAAYLAAVKGYSGEEVKLMKIAGLLHDLGKLTIPNAILEKPGRLTDKEYAVIKQHAYYSYRILAEIDDFQLVAEWAAYHHETLDGQGYPFRIDHSALGLGSRIVAVADVFSALVEDRPYRKALALREIETIMMGMADASKLDGELVGELLANPEELHLLTRAESSPAAIAK